MAKKTKEVRILTAIAISGGMIACNSVVVVQEAIADQWVKHGVADDNDAAVAYAKSEGAEPIDLTAIPSDVITDAVVLPDRSESDQSPPGEETLS